MRAEISAESVQLGVVRPRIAALPARNLRLLHADGASHFRLRPALAAPQGSQKIRGEGRDNRPFDSVEPTHGTRTVECLEERAALRRVCAEDIPHCAQFRRTRDDPPVFPEGHRRPRNAGAVSEMLPLKATICSYFPKRLTIRQFREALAANANTLSEKLAWLRRGLTAYVACGHGAGIADSLDDIGWVVGAEGRFDIAARLSAAAGKLRESVDAGLLPDAMRQTIEECTEMVRNGLDKTVFDEAWAAGRAMPLDDAVALALRGEIV